MLLCGQANHIGAFFMSTTEGQIIEKASKLSSEFQWVEEYHQRWIRILGACTAQLNMCHENKKGDPYAIDALTTMIELSRTKVDKCAAWLASRRDEYIRTMREVLNNGD